MSAVMSEAKPTALEADPEIGVMLDAGVHLGHARSKRHPAMTPYLWGVRANVEIIDLTKTKEKLGEALAFLRELARGGKLVLFVATRPAARDLVAKLAADLGYPAAIERWIDGTLTNFRVISKRIETLDELERAAAAGEFAKYTKREQVRKAAELERLHRGFGSLRLLRRIPDALVIFDLSVETTALREARRLGIPVVALADTNTDPRLVAYPIPANDDARPAVAYILERMRQAVREGQEEASAAQEAVTVPPEPLGERPQ